jgi:hypothetical protein
MRRENRLSTSRLVVVLGFADVVDVARSGSLSAAPVGGGMKTRLQCPCGELIVAESEDELVERAQRHLAEVHPELADHYTREQILFIAY